MMAEKQTCRYLNRYSRSSAAIKSYLASCCYCMASWTNGMGTSGLSSGKRRLFHHHIIFP